MKDGKKTLKEESVQEVINLYEVNDSLTQSAIDKIVVEIYSKSATPSRSRAVVVTGCSPHAGTTSICINLAIATANTGRKVLLVDCDLRKNDDVKKLNETTKQGLSDYLLEDVEQKVFSYIYQTNIDNLEYIPCGRGASNPARALCSNTLEHMINEVRQYYDFIVFDCPSVCVAPDAQIFFRLVDGIIYAAASGETRKSQIKDAKRLLKGYEDRYYGMIVNKLENRLYRKYVKDYDYYLLNKKGMQNLSGNVGFQKYRKEQKRKKDKQ